MLTTNEYNIIGFDELLQFLHNNGIETKIIDIDKYGFSRTIEFDVYGCSYRIVWYRNMSTLYIGKHERAPQIPFRYIELDTTYPLIGGNKSIAFAYTLCDSCIFSNKQMPFESFRIPLEIK